MAACYFRGYSLLVVKIPSLTSLGLRSLRKINDGGVYITGNKKLCYHDTVNWTRILTSGSRPQRRQKHIDVKENKPRAQCGEWGWVICKQLSCQCWWWWRSSFWSVHVCSQRGPCVRPPVLLWWLLGSGAKPVRVLSEIQQGRNLRARLHVLDRVSLHKTTNSINNNIQCLP